MVGRLESSELAPPSVEPGPSPDSTRSASERRGSGFGGCEEFDAEPLSLPVREEAPCAEPLRLPAVCAVAALDDLLDDADLSFDAVRWSERLLFAPPLSALPAEQPVRAAARTQVTTRGIASAMIGDPRMPHRTGELSQ
jgi:hypothetical protein